MKKFAKRFAALLAILALLFGAQVPEARAEASGVPKGIQVSLRGGESAQTGTRLQAGRSKKKKNTPTPAAASTPAPDTASPEPAADPTPTPVPEGPITDPQSIADYLLSHDMCLPDNFITKREAQALGWDSSRNYLSDVAPGMSIGGDRFGNYEGVLPTGAGITYREADCRYTGGRRNAYRVVYSSDGRVWYTEDHYETFTELFPTVP